MIFPIKSRTLQGDLLSRVHKVQTEKEVQVQLAKAMQGLNVTQQVSSDSSDSSDTSDSGYSSDSSDSSHWNSGKSVLTHWSLLFKYSQIVQVQE